MAFENDCAKLLIFPLFDVEQTIEYLKVTQDSSGRMFIPSARTFQSAQNPVFSSIAKGFFRYLVRREGTKSNVETFLIIDRFPNCDSLKNAFQGR